MLICRFQRAGAIGVFIDRSSERRHGDDGVPAEERLAFAKHLQIGRKQEHETYFKVDWERVSDLVGSRRVFQVLCGVRAD